MITWIWFTSNIVTVVAFVTPMFIRSRRNKKDESETHVETYGHPFDPVQAIRDALPDLEYPYQWETWIEKAGGDAWMNVHVVDLSSSLDEDGKFDSVTRIKSMNLVSLRIQTTIIEHIEDKCKSVTWKKWYETYSPDKNKSRRFHELVQEKIDGILDELSKKIGPKQIDYRLGK